MKEVRDLVVDGVELFLFGLDRSLLTIQATFFAADLRAEPQQTGDR